MVPLSPIDNEVFLRHLVGNHVEVVGAYNKLVAAHEVEYDALKFRYPSFGIKFVEIDLELCGDREVLLRL